MSPDAEAQARSRRRTGAIIADGSQTLLFWRCAAISSRPAAESTLMPCLMAFSTNPLEAPGSVHRLRSKIRWHVDVNFRAIMKACLFDFQILSDELEFALQGDLVLPPFEGHAQQVAEADQQVSCSIDVFLHRDSNGVKAAE